MVRSLAALIAFSVFLAAGMHSSGERVQARDACAPVVYAPAGTWHRDRLSGGPGLVLSGGGLMGMPYQRVLPWMRAHVTAPEGARAGNLVILKASNGRIYSDLFYRASRLGSVREMTIPPCASRRQVDALAHYVDGSDFVLFSGGDQAHYVPWKGSALIAAVKRVYGRGGVVGGGSAGLAVQGDVVFDSVADDRLWVDRDVATPDAVRNPYEPVISFTTNFLDWPTMRGTITDTHFARRNRFGRLAAFMARALHDRLIAQKTIYGIAVDEGAALLVNGSGVATLVMRPRETDGYVPKGAYVLRGGAAERIAPGKPLYYTVQVTHLTHAGSTYDLVTKRGSGARYTVTVDGARAGFYSRTPY